MAAISRRRLCLSAVELWGKEFYDVWGFGARVTLVEIDHVCCLKMASQTRNDEKNGDIVFCYR